MDNTQSLVVESQSALSQIFESPIVWSFIIGLVIAIIKIVAPQVISTVAFGDIEGLLLAICTLLHIPVLFTANAAIAQAKAEANVQTVSELPNIVE